MNDDLKLQSTLTLNNGVRIPRLGLGVFRTERGDETREAVAAALKAGYRHVDTARIYGNEEDVGEAIRASGLPRETIFVTTKLWNDDQGFEGSLRAFEGSLRRLGLDYVDLYLIHWPVPGRRLESWRGLEKLLADGKVRAIGVSNFLPRHLDELCERARVVPAVNQVELSPFLQQRELREYCARKGIAIEAYSPLTKGRRLSHPVLQEVARQVGRTSAQVLVRWCLQSGLIVLPKSARQERVRENAAVYDFELSPAQMQALDGLEEDLHTGWDPSQVP